MSTTTKHKYKKIVSIYKINKNTPSKNLINNIIKLEKYVKCCSGVFILLYQLISTP